MSIFSRQIDPDELVGMLEWLDCAKVRAEVELAGTERVGLFEFQALKAGA